MEQIVAETHAERLRLVSVLEGLSDDQWGSPSLCEGWRVREVVAHITMPFRIGPIRFVAGLLRARGRFDDFADRAARADAERLGDEALLEELRSNVTHPWRPPGGGAIGALSHDVIHGLDITEALELPGPPPERIGLVLTGAGEKSLSHFGVDLGSRRLIADDADAVVGVGEALVMPAAEILLVITGRRPLPDVSA